MGSKEKLERDKLQHKIKREMKGAIREIRKDNSFIAREKLKEQIEKYRLQIKQLFGCIFTNELNFVAEITSANAKSKTCCHLWPIRKEKSES